MWFNNVIVYQYELENEQELLAALQENILKSCPPHARFVYGWLPAFADELIHEVAGAAMLCVGKEERILPKTVINKMLAEKVQSLEIAQNRQVGRAERAQLAEDLEFDLLPKAFVIQKKQPAILDKMSQRLYINAASHNQASQLTTFLRKTYSAIKIEPIITTDNLAKTFAGWILDPASLPANFELASDCLLYSQEDEKKKINCKGYEQPAEEIITLLSQGLAAAEISLIWNERVQFTLTQDLVIKRLKCLDFLLDDFNDIKQLDEDYQQQDAALTLLAGELRALSDEIIKAVSENTSTDQHENKITEKTD